MDNPNQHSGADIKALAKSLKRVIEQAENNAGTLAAKESVKLVPAHWHAVIDVGRQAADALASAIAERDEARAELAVLRRAKKKPKVHTMEERLRMSDEKRYELYPEDFADGGW